MDLLLSSKQIEMSIEKILNVAKSDNTSFLSITKETINAINNYRFRKFTTKISKFNCDLNVRANVSIRDKYHFTNIVSIML
jgi:hypothetical protein